MSIFSRNWFGELISGGWKTHGPSQIIGPGAFDSGANEAEYQAVTATTAMNLSAVRACVELRSEIVGSLPCRVRDANKNVLHDHPLNAIVNVSPNYDMTTSEFFSLANAHVDLKGNSVNIIERIGKKVVALNPVDADNCQYEYNKAGSRKTWKIGQDTFPDEDILHFRGFSLSRDWAPSRIDIGRQIIAAQLTANTSALRAFKQGLKVGGFMANDGTRDFTQPELDAIGTRLAYFSRPENAGKWMTLLKGMKPIAGTEFSVKPSDAQLLESRYFGIEEICRLFGVPPQLIGHSNKASSWASSIENINLFFLMYSLQPTLIRMEQRMNKRLLTPGEVAQGIRIKFNIRSLLRADMKTQTAMFASALQNGYHNQDEVRDLLDMPPIPDGKGQEYRVQLNMANADPTANKDNQA